MFIKSQTSARETITIPLSHRPIYISNPFYRAPLWETYLSNKVAHCFFAKHSNRFFDRIICRSNRIISFVIWKLIPIRIRAKSNVNRYFGNNLHYEHIIIAIVGCVVRSNRNREVARRGRSSQVTSASSVNLEMIYDIRIASADKC